MILITTEEHHDATMRKSTIWVQSLIFNENELSTRHGSESTKI
jgi:hypothetical protein